MTVRHPAVHRHVVPFGWELIGAGLAGVLVTLIVLSALGVRVLPAPSDLPFRMGDLTGLMGRTQEATIPAEVGLAYQRHGEQGASFLSPSMTGALLQQRAGEIAEGSVVLPTWLIYREGEIAAGSATVTPTWLVYRQGEIAEGSVLVPTWVVYRQGEIAEGSALVVPSWSDYRQGEIRTGG
jgi:hypothetical protein